MGKQYRISDGTTLLLTSGERRTGPADLGDDELPQATLAFLKERGHIHETPREARRAAKAAEE